MKKMMTLRGFAGLLTLGSTALLLGACQDDVATGPSVNLLPRTEISGGPAPLDDSAYLVTLNWFGEDVDGEIDRFEFAWDDTSEWISTELTDSTFVIRSDSCCVYDTTSTSAGNDTINEFFFRFHTFFIRAVDNNGDVDPTPAHLTFNSITVAPTTRITKGSSGDGGTSVTGTAVSIRWEGTDPDSPESRVVGYEWFHATQLDLRIKYGYIPEIGVTREVWSALDWVRVSADTTQLVLRNLRPTANSTDETHFFFVRSIDEAGAIEQIPVAGRNWFRFGVAADPSGQVRIRSNVMGDRFSRSTFVDVGAVFEGAGLTFAWGADLSSYDGVVTGYRYAIDDPVWTAWGLDNVRFPDTGFFVPIRGRHTFFVQARDEAGLIVEGTFPFEVFAGPAELDTTSIMHWNDFYAPGDNRTYPDPVRLKEYWRDTLLVNFEVGEQFDPRENNIRDLPILELSRSTTLIIETDDSNGEGEPFISLIHDLNTNPIWSYVDAGGNLILLGFQPTWNFLPDNDYIDTAASGIPIPNFCYKIHGSWRNCGSTAIWWSPIVADSIGHPLYEYCGIETTFVVDGAGDEADRLWGAESRHPLLPDLVIDSTTGGMVGETGRGLELCEQYGYRDDRGIQELYGFQRVADPAEFDPSELPVGLFIPSDGRRGNVVILGLPIYYFQTVPAKEALESILISLFGESPKQ